jgi:hypothetical protein
LIFIFIFGRQLQPFRIQIHCPSWIQTNSDPCLDQKHLMILWPRTAIWLPVRRWRLIVIIHMLLELIRLPYVPTFRY